MKVKDMKEHYNSLDGIRAYAAIGIVLLHVLRNSAIQPHENYITGVLIPFFNSFVFLFMIISGFSLCCGYYDRFKNGMITPNMFYMKRYSRILPFFAILCIIDFCTSPGIGTLLETFADLTLCFGLMPTSVDIHVIGVGWFLGVVFLFYMLFPFFVFLLDNKRRAWLSLLISLGLCFSICIYFPVPQKHKSMIFCAPYFISGGLIFLYRSTICQLFLKNKFIVSVIIFATTLLYLSISKSLTSDFIKNTALVILFSLWTSYALCAKGIVLNNHIATYLSGISMEIYLAHMLVFRAVEKMHIETIISQADLLYIFNSLLTLLGVVSFAHVMKRYVLPALSKLASLAE